MTFRTRRRSRASTRPKASTPTPATSTSAASKNSRSAAPATTPALRAGRLALHQRQVGRRSVHRQLVQRLARQQHHRRQPARQPAVANSKDDDGFFARTPLNKGNPVDQQYDINFNVGGPIWKKRPWWFYSYRLDDQYKVVLGFPDLARSKLTNDYTGKVTFQLNRNNQLIGFTTSATSCRIAATSVRPTPLSAAQYQASKNYPVEDRVDERAQQRDVPRRALRRLGQLLPAATDE